MAKHEHWKTAPDEHDYPAAQDYLSLVFPPDVAASIVDGLRDAPLVRRKAKDLLRASDLPGLPESNVHVAGDLTKVRRDEKLSPVLLVRGDNRDARRLVIADGYHRICASYILDEDADIPCRIVSPPVMGRVV